MAAGPAAGSLECGADGRDLPLVEVELCFQLRRKDAEHIVQPGRALYMCASAGMRAIVGGGEGGVVVVVVGGRTPE